MLSRHLLPFLQKIKLVGCIFLDQHSRQYCDQQIMASSDEVFPYFAYGSNLLAARIHMQNPSATFRTVARLDNYCLEFDLDGDGVWKGCAATITESPGSHVWGVVWTLNKSDIENLDRQEGVGAGIYKPVNVDVTSEGGELITCRSYYLLKRGSADRRPSPQYLDVIVRGAVQHNLPSEYVEFLRNFQHNGYPGPVQLYDDVMSRVN